MLTTQLKGKHWVLGERRHNLSTKNFISAFELIQCWHNFKKSTINNRAAMFRIPHVFARIYSQCSFYVFLTRGGSVGTRSKQLFPLPFPILSGNFLVSFWITDLIKNHRIFSLDTVQRWVLQESGWRINRKFKCSLLHKEQSLADATWSEGLVSLYGGYIGF